MSQQNPTKKFKEVFRIDSTFTAAERHLFRVIEPLLSIRVRQHRIGYDTTPSGDNSQIVIVEGENGSETVRIKMTTIKSLFQWEVPYTEVFLNNWRSLEGSSPVMYLEANYALDIILKLFPNTEPLSIDKFYIEALDFDSVTHYYTLTRYCDDGFIKIRFQVRREDGMTALQLEIKTRNFNTHYHRRSARSKWEYADPNTADGIAWLSECVWLPEIYLDPRTEYLQFVSKRERYEYLTKKGLIKAEMMSKLREYHGPSFFEA